MVRQSLKTAIILFVFAALPLFSSAHAETQGDAAAQANNPLANMKAFNLQNYYIGEISEADSSEDANQFWLRYAQPISLGDTKWIMRASLPVNTYPTASSDHKLTGFGDFNIFAAYLIDMDNPAVSFGIGPQLTAPTSTYGELGSEKWSAGFANVLFNASSPKFQYGYLLTWQHSFAGESDRNTVDIAALQPFLFYQLGSGWYVRSAPIMAYNFENDGYSVPIGVGAGKVIKKGKTVFNFFIEPQYSIADDGPGWPEWQIFAACNMQFLN